MPNPLFIPDCPPGYVFFSNITSTFDPATKKAYSAAILRKELSDRYGIDPSDILVLQDVVVPFGTTMPFSVFLPLEYKAWVDAFVSDLHQALELLIEHLDEPAAEELRLARMLLFRHDHNRNQE